MHRLLPAIAVVLVVLIMVLPEAAGAAGSRPHVVLDVATERPVPGGLVLLRAKGRAPGADTVTRYEWDFDADGQVDASTEKGATRFRLPATFGTGLVGVRVVTSRGRTAGAFARLRATAPRLRRMSAQRLRGTAPRFRLAVPSMAGDNARYMWRIVPAPRFGRRLESRSDRAQVQVTRWPILVHTFAGRGSFDVAMYAYTADGSSSIIARRVHVGGEPGQSFPMVYVDNADPRPRESFSVVVGTVRPTSGAIRWKFDAKGTGSRRTSVFVHEFESARRNHVTVSAPARALGGRAAQTAQAGAVSFSLDSAYNALFACQTVNGAAVPTKLCDTPETFAECMITLRDGAGPYRCEMVGNAVHDAEDLAPGAAYQVAGCTVDQALPFNGYRCTSNSSYLRCRETANGGRHQTFLLDHCARSIAPAELEVTQTASMTLTESNAADGFDDVVNAEAEVDIKFTPAPMPPSEGSCNPATAALFGESCVRGCQQAYFETQMLPDGPTLPVIQGRPCATTFAVSTNAGLGDESRIARATCSELLDGRPAGTIVGYTTTIWVKVWATFLYNDPQTSQQGSPSWFDLMFGGGFSASYSDSWVPSESPLARVGVPMAVSCRT